MGRGVQGGGGALHARQSMQARRLRRRHLLQLRRGTAPGAPPLCLRPDESPAAPLRLRCRPVRQASCSASSPASSCGLTTAMVSLQPGRLGRMARKWREGPGRQPGTPCEHASTACSLVRMRAGLAALPATQARSPRLKQTLIPPSPRPCRCRRCQAVLRALQHRRPLRQDRPHLRRDRLTLDLGSHAAAVLQRRLPVRCQRALLVCRGCYHPDPAVRHPGRAGEHPFPSPEQPLSRVEKIVRLRQPASAPPGVPRLLHLAAFACSVHFLPTLRPTGSIRLLDAFPPHLAHHCPPPSAARLPLPQIKRRAPTAHTMLEIVKARWGATAHKVFFVFAIATNSEWQQGGREAPGWRGKGCVKGPALRHAHL